MPWKSQILPGLPIIETIFEGRISAQDLAAAVAEVVDLARQHHVTLILADCRKLEGGHSITSLYQAAESVRACGVTYFKEAVLLPALPEAQGHVAFWETTAVNRGFEVKIFGNRDDAMSWLTAK